MDSSAPVALSTAVSTKNPQICGQLSTGREHPSSKLVEPAREAHAKG